MPLSAAVTYPVLGAILSGLLSTVGVVYGVLANAHENGGHGRHDRQIEQLEDRHHREMQEHLNREAILMERLEYAMRRVELKQDRMLERTGIGFPARVGPLREMDPRSAAKAGTLPPPAPPPRGVRAPRDGGTP